MQSVQDLLIKIVNKVTANLTREMIRMACFALGMPGCSPRQASLGTIVRVAGVLVFVAGVPAWAQTEQEAQPPCSNEAFPLMTYDEDNRHFSNPDCRTEFLDRLKFIPLRGDNEDYYLS